MFCPECGADNEDIASYCVQCGTKLELPVFREKGTPSPAPEAQPPRPPSQPRRPPPAPPAAQAKERKPFRKRTLVLAGLGIAVAVVVAVVIFVLLAVCAPSPTGFDDLVNGTATPSPSVVQTVSPSPTSAVATPARLVRVGAAPHGEADKWFPSTDWIVFEFEGGSPTRSIRWLGSPPADVDGTAFLEVAFAGATASEPSTGEATFEYPRLSALQVVADLKQTSDDGGNLILVIGVSQKTDYVDLSVDAATSAVIVQWSPGPNADAPHAAPVQLDQGVALLREGLEEITLAPGDSHSIDNLALAEDWDFTPPPCADYVFYLSWQVRRPFPPDAVEVEVYGSQQGGRQLLGEEPSGALTTGCDRLEIVNTGAVEITMELRYVFASSSG